MYHELHTVLFWWSFSCHLISTSLNVHLFLAGKFCYDLYQIIHSFKGVLQRCFYCEEIKVLLSKFCTKFDFAAEYSNISLHRESSSGRSLFSTLIFIFTYLILNCILASHNWCCDFLHLAESKMSDEMVLLPSYKHHLSSLSSILDLSEDTVFSNIVHIRVNFS